MQERKLVKSYTNVWRLNRTFYSAGGIDLPMPMSMNFMIYMFFAEIPVNLFFGFLPSMMRYVIIPGTIAWLCDQKLLDGKNPFQFIRSLVIYYYLVLVKGPKINRYRHYKNENPSLDIEIAVRPYKKS